MGEILIVNGKDGFDKVKTLIPSDYVAVAIRGEKPYNKEGAGLVEELRDYFLQEPYDEMTNDEILDIYDSSLRERFGKTNGLIYMIIGEFKKGKPDIGKIRINVELYDNEDIKTKEFEEYFTMMMSENMSKEEIVEARFLVSKISNERPNKTRGLASIIFGFAAMSDFMRDADNIVCRSMRQYARGTKDIFPRREYPIPRRPEKIPKNRIYDKRSGIRGRR